MSFESLLSKYEREDAHKERLSALFNKNDDKEYLKYERIPQEEKLHPDRTICTFMKIHSLLNEGKSLDMHGEHDELYLNHLIELKEETTEEDVIYLLRCGISLSSEYGCLRMFAG